MLHLLTMTHYVTEAPDGLYHVQNAVGGFLGQHHVHTKEGYEQWRKETENSTQNRFSGPSAGHCDCGLGAGQMRSGK